MSIIFSFLVCLFFGGEGEGEGEGLKGAGVGGKIGIPLEPLDDDLFDIHLCA